MPSENHGKPTTASQTVNSYDNQRTEDCIMMDISYFEYLSDEIVLEIFKHLNPIALLKVIPSISKRFYNLSNDETTLWQSLCLQAISSEHWKILFSKEIYFNERLQKYKSWKWLWMSKMIKYQEGMTGVASHTYENNVIYEGDFKEGKRCGFGVSHSENRFEYIGEWQNDKKHGLGKQRWTDGSVYEGQWKEGVKQGYGKYCWSDGEYYEGYWEGDEEHGYGVYHWSSEDVYSGEWVKGSKHGQGYHLWGNGPWKGDSYRGEWKNDTQYGHGEYIWNDGRSYMGDWQGHKRHGYGVYKFPDGSVHRGYWGNGFRHGNGEYITSSGVKYMGIWNNDTCTEIPDPTWDRFFLRSKEDQRDYVKSICNKK